MESKLNFNFIIINDISFFIGNYDENRILLIKHFNIKNFFINNTLYINSSSGFGFGSSINKSNLDQMAHSGDSQNLAIGSKFESVMPNDALKKKIPKFSFKK